MKRSGPRRLSGLLLASALAVALVLAGPLRAAPVAAAVPRSSAQFILNSEDGGVWPWLVSKGGWKFNCGGAGYWDTETDGIMGDYAVIKIKGSCSYGWAFDLAADHPMQVYASAGDCGTFSARFGSLGVVTSFDLTLKTIIPNTEMVGCTPVAELCFWDESAAGGRLDSETACVPFALGAPPELSTGGVPPGGAGCPGTPSKIETQPGWDWKPRPGDPGRYSAQGSISFTVTPGIDPERAGSMYWWVALWSGDASNALGANARRMIPMKWTFAEYGEVDVTMVWGEVDVLPGGNTVDIPNVSVGRSGTAWGTSVVLGAGIGFSSHEDHPMGPDPHPEYAPPTAPDGLGQGFVGWSAPEHCYWSWGLKWFDRSDTDYDDPLGPIVDDTEPVGPPPVVHVGPPGSCDPEADVCVEIPPVDDSHNEPDSGSGGDSCGDGFKVSDPSTWAGAAMCGVVKMLAAVLKAVGRLISAVLGIVGSLLSGLASLFETLFVPDASLLSARIEGVKDALTDGPVGDWTGALGDAFGPSGSPGGCEGPTVDLSSLGVPNVDEIRPFAACSGKAADAAGIVRMVASVGIGLTGGMAIARMVLAALGIRVGAPGSGRGGETG